MFLKTLKKIALSGLKLFGLASWFLNPKTPLLVFKHCFQHILWCDVFISYILRFFHDRHASKVGSYLRKKRREMHNLVLNSVYVSSYIFLILFVCFFIIYTLIYPRKDFTFKGEINIFNNFEKKKIINHISNLRMPTFTRHGKEMCQPKFKNSQCENLINKKN